MGNGGVIDSAPCHTCHLVDDDQNGEERRVRDESMCEQSLGLGVLFAAWVYHGCRLVGRAPSCVDGVCAFFSRTCLDY